MGDIGERKEKTARAFKEFAGEGGKIPADYLFKLLTSVGDKLTEAEAKDILEAACPGNSDMDIPTFIQQMYDDIQGK